MRGSHSLEVEVPGKSLSRIVPVLDEWVFGLWDQINQITLVRV